MKGKKAMVLVLGVVSVLHLGLPDTRSRGGQSAGGRKACVHPGAGGAGPVLTTTTWPCKVQCHTPRDDKGDSSKAKAFRGRRFRCKRRTRCTRNGPWGRPPSRAFQGFTDEEEIAMLTTGRRGPHRPAAPDAALPAEARSAEAIVAYLRSL